MKSLSKLLLTSLGGSVLLSRNPEGLTGLMAAIHGTANVAELFNEAIANGVKSSELVNAKDNDGWFVSLSLSLSRSLLHTYKIL